MKGFRFWVCTACLGLFCLALPADVSAAARRPYGGSLTLPLIGTIDTTDPVRVASFEEWQMASQVHETLFRMRQGQVLPALAQRPPEVRDGGREVLIFLRPDATFHDGSEVTSSEVIASWQRLLNPQTNSDYWWLLAPVQGAVEFHRSKRTRITGLERVNKLTIRVRLETTADDFLPALCTLPTAILPMRELRHEGEAHDHPAGAGPFRWVEGEEGQSLEAFIHHWRGRPYLDSIQLESFETPRDATLAFELGKVDLSRQEPPSTTVPYSRLVFPENQLVLLAVNEERTKNLPQGFRLALSQAIDRRSLAHYIVGERGRAFDELIVTGAEDEEVQVEAADPAKAKSYFKGIAVGRMGVPVMLEFIVHKGDAFERSAAERIQVNLVAVGVSVAISELSGKEYADRLAAAEYDLRLVRPLPLVGQASLQLLGAVARVGDPAQVSDLLKVMDRLPEDGSRAGILRERARGLRMRVPWIPLFVFGPTEFLRERIRELIPDERGLLGWADAWYAR